MWHRKATDPITAAIKQNRRAGIKVTKRLDKLARKLGLSVPLSWNLNTSGSLWHGFFDLNPTEPQFAYTQLPSAHFLVAMTRKTGGHFYGTDEPDLGLWLAANLPDCFASANRLEFRLHTQADLGRAMLLLPPLAIAS